MYKLFAIAKNTFKETIRQPIYAVLIFCGLLLIAISPSITMYSLDDDTKFLREIGLSTLFLTGLFIAIFSAAGAVAEEVENKTIIMVISKPVQRPIFIIAKFLGVLAAVALAHYICTTAMLMAIRYGVLESVRDKSDWTVITAAVVVAAMSLLLAAFFNYVYDWKFTSTAIILIAISVTIAMVFLALIDRDWQFNPQNNSFNAVDVYGSLLLLMAVTIMVAIAVALSTRFNMAVTLSACIGIFLLGLISDYTFGRFADEYLLAKVGRFIVPSLQVFWISDAIYESSTVPFKYIVISSVYAVCYTAAILSVAVGLFQKRQVG